VGGQPDFRQGLRRRWRSGAAAACRLRQRPRLLLAWERHLELRVHVQLLVARRGRGRLLLGSQVEGPARHGGLANEEPLLLLLCLLLRLLL
jgi:hypothetical protein